MKIIPDNRKWLNRECWKTDFQWTLVLTGHGCFRAYLYRSKRTDMPNCLDCGQEPNDFDHTAVDWVRWNHYREEQGVVLGEPLPPKNITGRMTAGEIQWKAVESMIQKFVGSKTSAEIDGLVESLPALLEVILKGGSVKGRLAGVMRSGFYLIVRYYLELRITFIGILVGNLISPC